MLLYTKKTMSEGKSHCARSNTSSKHNNRKIAKRENQSVIEHNCKEKGRDSQIFTAAAEVYVDEPRTQPRD